MPRIKKIKRERNGQAKGGKRSRVMRIYTGMLTRCYNKNFPKYPDYGGRGIQVCYRWQVSFLSFLEDMGYPLTGMSIERIDNNKNYKPSNCRWATPYEQARNKRANVVLVYNGETRVLVDWARHMGVGRQALTKRLVRGWSVERALTEPIRIKHRRLSHENTRETEDNNIIDD